MTTNTNSTKGQFLITGSTDGIGLAVAEEILSQGYGVIIHGRNPEKTLETKILLEQLYPGLEINALTADLSSIKQTMELCNGIKKHTKSLAGIINNAGSYFTKRELTAEKIEKTFMVNYLSRFIIIRELLPLLKNSDSASVVDVSGMYHKKGQINFNDINLEQGYTADKANTQAKLANVLFSFELAERLKDTGIRVNTIHPGAVATGLISKDPNYSSFMKWLYGLFRPFLLTPKQAAVFITALTVPQVTVTGQYFEKNKQAKPSPLVFDRTLRKRLWDLSEELIKR